MSSDFLGDIDCSSDVVVAEIRFPFFHGYYYYSYYDCY